MNRRAVYVLILLACVAFVRICAVYGYALIFGDEEIQAVQKATEEAKEDVREVVRKYRTVVIAHDKEVKEAGKNAVKTVDYYSDDAVLNAFNDFITSARKRNTERRRAVSADK